MLSHEENERLTKVSPGAAMGEMLRRYWMPIAPVTELEEHPTKPVRLLGEDLVLFKNKRGDYGLVDRYCAHRGADLSHGMLEECGLRCVYHGWLYDQDGKCRAQPFEDAVNPTARFKERIRIQAYPVEANAGLLWAYLGPAPAPVVPNWRNFSRKGYKHLCFVHLPCNWLQAMENAFDQVHNEWMHDKWSFYLRDGSVPEDRWRIKNFVHRAFDYGWTAEIEYEGYSDIFPDRVIVWPNYSYFSGFEWLVPIDDENTLVIYQHCTRFYGDAPFTQERIPYWTGAVKAPGTNSFLTSPPRNQDFLVWSGQGRVADRTNEHLGASDLGITMFRRELKKQMKIVHAGGEPRGVIRDPEEYFLMFPEPVPSGPERDGLPGALRTPADIRTIGYVAGFPEEIADEIERISAERDERTHRAQLLKGAGWKVGGKDFNRRRHFASLRNRGLVDHVPLIPKSESGSA